jgi:hypothetical protein
MIKAKSHSTGVLAVAIANLLPELRQVCFTHSFIYMQTLGCRWNPKNLILIGTLPGPVETKTSQVSNYLEPLVDKLLVLWNTPQTIIDGKQLAFLSFYMR